MGGENSDCGGYVTSTSPHAKKDGGRAYGEMSDRVERNVKTLVRRYGWPFKRHASPARGLIEAAVWPLQHARGSVGFRYGKDMSSRSVSIPGSHNLKRGSLACVRLGCVLIGVAVVHSEAVRVILVLDPVGCTCFTCFKTSHRAK